MALRDKWTRDGIVMDLRALGSVFYEKINHREHTGSQDCDGVQLCFQNPKDKVLEILPCWEHRAWGWCRSRMMHLQCAASRSAAMACTEDITVICVMVHPLLCTPACRTGRSSSGTSVQIHVHRSEKEGISSS